jgi:hypothetical protein
VFVVLFAWQTVWLLGHTTVGPQPAVVFLHASILALAVVSVVIQLWVAALTPIGRAMNTVSLAFLALNLPLAVMAFSFDAVAT